MTSASTPQRTPIVAGNWKMNYGPAEAHAFTGTILEGLNAIHAVERVLCPPAISIPAVHSVVNGSEIKLGAQNIYFEDKGAFTGEIAPGMLRGLCDYVILGHSERRAYFGETDELVNKKTRAAFAHGLRPIVCVGERLEERDANLTERVITTQVRGSLAGLLPEQFPNLVVAYEPVWAIGTGRAATTQDAADVAALIRALIGERYGRAAAQVVRIQYGGSVNLTNVADLAAVPDIDGSLVGGASLTGDFIELVRRTAQAKTLA